MMFEQKWILLEVLYEEPVFCMEADDPTDQDDDHDKGVTIIVWPTVWEAPDG